MNTKKNKMAFYTLMSVLVIFMSGFLGLNLYANDYYRAEDSAISILQTNNSIEILGNLTILKGDSDIGIIFYPGAKVEAIAYLPILEKLQAEGLTCVLVEMPYNMAIFNVNGADDILLEDISSLSNVERWYMAGHSMGGGMASSYASKNQDLIDGLILMGAYVYGDYPPENALTIYGTHNSNLEEKIDYTQNIFIIEGGNHAQFGNYGKQKGDPDADITPQNQQDITVEEIVKFVYK
ncbi:MAG: alpha/beta fold hydrolase [bacterium]